MGLAGVCIIALAFLMFSSRSSDGMPLVQSEEQSLDQSSNARFKMNKREIQIETGSIQIGGAADGVNSTSVRIVYGQPTVTKQSKNNWRQRRYSQLNEHFISDMEKKSQEMLFANEDNNDNNNVQDVSDQEENYDEILDLDSFEKRKMTPNSSPSLDSFVAMRGKKKKSSNINKKPHVIDTSYIRQVPQSLMKNSFRPKRNYRQPDYNNEEAFFAMRGRRRRTPFHNKGHIGDIFIGMRG